MRALNLGISPRHLCACAQSRSGILHSPFDPTTKASREASAVIDTTTNDVRACTLPLLHMGHRYHGRDLDGGRVTSRDGDGGTPPAIIGVAEMYMRAKSGRGLP